MKITIVDMSFQVLNMKSLAQVMTAPLAMFKGNVMPTPEARYETKPERSTKDEL